MIPGWCFHLMLWGTLGAMLILLAPRRPQPRAFWQGWPEHEVGV